MSRKFTLLGMFIILITLSACELSPPVTAEPSPTETDSPIPDIVTNTPLPPTETDVTAPTFTDTASPTIAILTDTPTIRPTDTPTATFTPEPVEYPYVVQEGCPLYMPNFAHPSAGCDWLGIAGQVFNGDVAVESLVVIVGGTLDGNPIDMLTMTGRASDYGAGGYEFILSSTVVASEGTVWVQVLGLDGLPLTAKTYINTRAECMENLILLNFALKGE